MKVLSSLLFFLAIASTAHASDRQQLIIRVSLSQQKLSYWGVDQKGKTVNGQTRILPQRANQDALHRIPRGTFTLVRAYDRYASTRYPVLQMTDVLFFRGEHNIQSSARWQERLARGQDANGAIVIPKAIGAQILRYARVVGLNNTRVIITD